MIKVITPNPLIIFVVRRDILLMSTGARMQISMTNLKTWVTIKSAKRKVIRQMNAKPEPYMHQYLKVTSTTIRSMDIEPLSADLSLCCHQTNRQRQEFMNTSTIETTILGKAITVVKSMDTSLRTT